MRTLLALFLIIFGLYSCRPDEQHTRYHHQMDSLLTELEKMDEELNSLKIRKVEQIHDSLALYYDTTRVTDTLQHRHQTYVQSRNILQWYDHIDREITFSRSHLKALQRQNMNKRLDTVTIQELEKEKQIVGNLKERFGLELQGLRRQIGLLLNKK
jgi:uncharacterized protein YcfL